MAVVEFNIIHERALDLLSRRDHSRRELRDKLIRKFGMENSEQIDEVCDELERVDLLDDSRFARAYSEELIRRKHVSPAGLRAALIKKGISRQEAVLVMEEANIDPQESIRTLLETKYKRYDLFNEGDAHKVFNCLVIMGFNYSDIKAVFHEILEGENSLYDFE